MSKKVTCTLLAIVAVVAATAPCRPAKSCGCPPPSYVDLITGICQPAGVRLSPTAGCSLEVSATHVERQAGQPVRITIGFTISNWSFPPATTFVYSIGATAERFDAGLAASTVAWTRAGVASSCAIGGSGTCATTFAPDPPGLVTLDPIGLTLPDYPTVFRGETVVTLDCGPCSDSALATFTLTVTPSFPGGGCSTSTCIELMPCDSYGDSGVPVIDTRTPVVCADNAESVPVTFRVIRNQFPASRLPLVATVSAANAVDPTDLFTVFPRSFALDFGGGAETEQEVTVGCHTHGPCFAGVSNSLSVTLADKHGVPVASPTGLQLVRVITCDVPLVRKNLEHQSGNQFRYAIVARNPSLDDAIRDVVITDRFPGQRILSVEGSLAEFMFDDPLGFVTPLAARLVPATVTITGEELRIAGFDLTTRDLSNVRVIPDTVTFEVVTETPALPACGPMELNAGPVLTGSRVLPTGLRQVSWTAEGLHATCVCPHTQGYWKTHHSGAKNPSQQQPWPLAESSTLCGKTWLEWFGTPPRGDAWLILAHQWMAARLNVAAGAATNGDVDVNGAIAEATVLLGGCAISQADRARATALAGLLDDFNNDRFHLRACTAH